MIRALDIFDYKCLHTAEMMFGKLNLITGKNSSGKSSVIQALKLFADNLENKSTSGSKVTVSSSQYDIRPFSETCNIYTVSSEYVIKVLLGDSHSFSMTFTPSDESRVNTMVTVEENVLNADDKEVFPAIFHLPATRINNQDIYLMNNTPKIPLGKQGEFVIDYFFNHRQDRLDDKLLVAETNDNSLDTQVNHWLYKLTGYTMEVERRSEQYDVYFKDYIGNRIRPSQVGTGVGYIAAVLIVCLGSPIGSFIAIENPEIHLHPKAQSDLTEFLAIVGAAGNQLLIETHSDHIINGMLVRVKEAEVINNDDLKIYYFEEDDDCENCMAPKLLAVSPKGKISKAPRGFFDQIQIDLRKLLGM
jgi:predicted ATPase